MAKVQAYHIKTALAEKHHDDFFMTEVKNGPSYAADQLLILDAVAIKKAWKTPLFSGYEVKISRSDFLQDDKWRGYMDYVHCFSFVCPEGLIKKAEVPEDVGLYYYDHGKKKLRTIRKPKYRDIPIQPEFLMYILMYKLDSDRMPFVGFDLRHYYELWKENKLHKEFVGKKLSVEISILRKQLENKQERYERVSEDLREIKDVCQKHGISRWANTAKELDKVLSVDGALSIQDLQALKDIKKGIDRLEKRYLEVAEEEAE